MASSSVASSGNQLTAPPPATLTKTASATMHFGIVLLEHLTVDELKARLKRHKLPSSGTKLQLIKRLKLAQLPDEELKQLCRCRGLQVGTGGNNNSGRISLSSETAGDKSSKKALISRRDMICALEKFPSIVNMACQLNLGPNGVENCNIGNDEFATKTGSRNQASKQQPDDAWMPGYRATELLNYNTDDYYAIDGQVDDTESQAPSSTAERVLDWLISRPVLRCLDCKKLLPDKAVVTHLARDHNLDYETAPPAQANCALLFKATSFESIMSLYVWVRPTATFRDLISLIAHRWFASCKPCNHIATVYMMPDQGSRPLSVFYNQLHDKVDLGPMFPMQDPLHAHLVEILQRRPFRLLFGERTDITQVEIRFCKQLNIKPALGQDGRQVDGGLLAESLLPEIPCASCGRLATMTVASRQGGLCHVSRKEFFCGKRCATKAGFKARLVKLANSPRCSSCRCAVFVYPASVPSWQAADEEEQRHQQSTDQDQEKDGDIGAMGDFADMEEAVDEIILLPEGVDASEIDEPATWKRPDQDDNDQDGQVQDVAEYYNDDEDVEPKEVDIDSNNIENNDENVEPEVEIVVEGEVDEDDDRGRQGGDDTLTESTMVDQLCGSAGQLVPDNGGGNSTPRVLTHSVDGEQAGDNKTPPLAVLSKQIETVQKQQQTSTPISDKKTMPHHPHDPPTVIRKPISRLAMITNDVEPQEQKAPTVGPRRLDAILSAVKTGGAAPALVKTIKSSGRPSLFG